MKDGYFGKTLLCRTSYEGKSITGKVSFSPEKVDVKLLGFEDFVYFRDGDIISLNLEDNQYCTATTFANSPGTHSSGNGSFHHIDCGVRQAIIGFRPWTSEDRVSEIYFELSNTNQVLEAPDIRRKIASSKIGEEPENKIIEVSYNGITIKIYYNYSMPLHEDNYKVLEPYGHIIFEQPKPVGEIGQIFAILRTFLTMSSGVSAMIDNYMIVPSKNAEQALLSGGFSPAMFELIWPSIKIKDGVHENIRPSNILRCHTEDDRKAMSDCLMFWMANWKKWKPAFYGMQIATEERRNFDFGRIINACKWLDSTPGAQQENLNYDEKIDSISDAAIRKARELGLDMDNRISGAIKWLRTESRDQLFRRLVDQAVQGESDELKQRLIKDIHLAYEIRGHFAHNKFYHTSDEGFGEYILCTQAVEALAFLLLYRNLPLPSDHFWGHGHNNFISYLNY